MSLRHWGMAVLAALSLAGCASNTTKTDASPEQVAQALYRHPGPPEIRLYTMVSNRSGSGAHTSLMINASQRVIFDPAGSVRHSAVPESGDVLYGITPRIEKFYASAHARSTYHVLIQSVPVSAEVAEQALRLVQANGPVAQSLCTSATSGILRKLPGFESIRPTYFPNALAEQFAGLPGVTTQTVYEDDADDKQIAIAAFDPDAPVAASP